MFVWLPRSELRWLFHRTQWTSRKSARAQEGAVQSSCERSNIRHSSRTFCGVGVCEDGKRLVCMKSQHECVCPHGGAVDISLSSSDGRRGEENWERRETTVAALLAADW
jgi:hypothetical protein